MTITYNYGLNHHFSSEAHYFNGLKFKSLFFIMFHGKLTTYLWPLNGMVWTPHELTKIPPRQGRERSERSEKDRLESQRWGRAILRSWV